MVGGQGGKGGGVGETNQSVDTALELGSAYLAVGRS